MVKRIYYNKTNTCEICGKDFFGKALKEYKNEKETGRWICQSCYSYIRNYGTADMDKVQQIRNKYIQRKLKKYNETNTCQRIKNTGEICGRSLVPTKACKEYDKDGKETGRWICANCWAKDDRKERYDSLAGYRTGNLDPTCSTAIGNLFEELTEIWKNVKNLNKELDCYNTSLDHSADHKGKIQQTRSAFYNQKYRRWSSCSFRNEWKKEFHYVILYCASEDGKIIERVYIIPKSEIVGRTCINILKYDSKGNLYDKGWYEKYRITDEEEIKNVNEIWKKITKDKKIKKTIFK